MNLDAFASLVARESAEIIETRANLDAAKMYHYRVRDTVDSDLGYMEVDAHHRVVRCQEELTAAEARAYRQLQIGVAWEVAEQERQGKKRERDVDDDELPERLVVKHKSDVTGSIKEVLYQPRYTVVPDGPEEETRLDIFANGEDLEVVRPLKRDRVYILNGEMRGCTGVLLGIDDNHGIVKMDANGDISIVPLYKCGKLAED